MSTEKFRIHAELYVERISVDRNDDSDDPKTNYIAYSSSWMASDGQIPFSCRPSQLEATLRQIFRTEDPMMKKTQGLLPNMHSSLSGRMTVTTSGGVTTAGQPTKKFLLTREPIYKAPEGSTKDLILNIGRELLGREPGAGVDLFGELLDDIITPKKKEVRR